MILSFILLLCLVFGLVYKAFQGQSWPNQATDMTVKAKPWSFEEKENLTHFVNSQITHSAADEAFKSFKEKGHESTEAYQAHIAAALEEAKKARPDVLNRLHPEMATQFKTNYIGFLESWLGFLGDARSEPSVDKGQAWSDWCQKVQSNITFPEEVLVYSDSAKAEKWFRSHWDSQPVPMFVEDKRVPAPKYIPSDWSKDDKLNIVHFVRARKLHAEASEALRERKDHEVLVNLRAALGEAVFIKDSVVAKAHRELPSVFRETFVRSLESTIKDLETKRFDFESIALLKRWAYWWNANKNDVLIPLEAFQ
jgi:hypothetical protein